MDHAESLYRIGIQKFPTSTSLIIAYAFFLMERRQRIHEAIRELTSAEAFRPPFDEQFIIYRYKKMNEDQGDDLIANIAYESSLRQCFQYIEKVASLHLDFWTTLREDRPDIAKLNSIGSKINNNIIMVETHWSAVQKHNSGMPRDLRIYSKFLIEVLNDKEGGQEYLTRA